jgi:phosphoglycolate phosphatase-like HAD superfamily hydrolase
VVHEGRDLPQDRVQVDQVTVLYLFDIDGTLLHAHGSGRGAFDQVFAELHGQEAVKLGTMTRGHHGVTDASRGIRYGGKTDPAIVDEIFAARLGRAPSDGERSAFLDAYVPRLRALLARDGVEVLAGVHESLAFLRGKAVLGVATGNIRAGADAKLEAAGLGGEFELGGYGCDSKIRSELVAKAIQRAGRVDEVVVVGDTIHDIAAARACGATVCAVATGADPAEALAHADGVLATLRDLPAWHAARFG